MDASYACLAEYISSYLFCLHLAPNSIALLNFCMIFWQSVVIHLAGWSVRLQWLGDRHSVESLRKYYAVVLGDNS
jgi:hypothetical protein